MKSLLIVLILTFMYSIAWASTPVVTGAKVRIQHKKYQDAVDVLEENMSKYPDDSELYYYLGRAYAGLAQWAKAGENFSMAMSKNPEKELLKEIDKWRDFYWAGFVKDAQALLQQKRFGDAVGKFRLANAINDSHKESFANMGVALLEQGQIYQSADPAQPDSAKMMYDEAIEAFNRAIELDPEDTQFVKNLAHAYTISGQLDKSIEMYENLMDENPEDQDIRDRLVRIYMAERDFDNAARIYSMMMDDPGIEISTADYYNAGMCFFQLAADLEKKDDDASRAEAQKKYSSAAECFSNVYDSDPTDCDAGTQLYYVYISLDQWENVQKTISTMLDNSCPRDMATLQNLGVAYLKMDDKPKAAAVFKEVEELKASGAEN